MKLSWVVLTATVNVHQGVEAVVGDPLVRFSQYQDSLAQWLAMAKREGFRVMVVENSGADLRTLRMGLTAEARARLQILGLEVPPPDVAQRGKGACESLMIDQVMRAVDSRPADWIAKVTGRLFVRNLPRTLPRRGDRLSVVMRGTLGGGYVDSRLLLARHAIWSTTFKGMANQVDDPAGLFLEHVIARRVIEAELATGLGVGRFRKTPEFVGVSGTSGQRYTGGVLLKRMLSSPMEYALRVIPRDKQF